MPHRPLVYLSSLLLILAIAGLTLLTQQKSHKFPDTGETLVSSTPENPHSPIAIQPVEIEIEESLQPNVPALPPSDSWESATVLEESFEFSHDTTNGLALRHRIIKDNGFPFPIRITDEVEFDDQGNARTLQEISAYAANQILLVPTASLSQQYAIDIADALGWEYSIEASSRNLAVIQSQEYGLSTVPEALAAIELSGNELIAEPNHIFYATVAPNDPRYSDKSLWGLNQTSDFDIDAPEGWSTRHDASNVTIAVIDTGINLQHEDLKPNLWTNPGELAQNGVDDDGNGYIDDYQGANFIIRETAPNDDNGHGSHVSGIAGARGNNGTGISGVAWTVKLMPIKSLNSYGKGSTSDLVSGIDYAIINNADLINASWGNSTFSQAIEQAISRANEQGIIVVAAAGNDGLKSPSYPSSSSLPNVVSVAAANKSGKIATFSNYHPTEVDVIAPGTDILSTWQGPANAYSQQDGTSMAAPFVSGILALFISEYPNDSYIKQIRRLIVSSKPTSGFQSYCAARGLVNLKNGLDMETVFLPPTVEEGTYREIFAYEGESVKLVANAIGSDAFTYRWKRGETLLGETSSSLQLSTLTPNQAGTYTLEIVNGPASTIVTFELTVYPRMHDIEANLENGLIVFASRKSDWKIIQQNGSVLIQSSSIPFGRKSFLEFRTPEDGLLRVTGRKPLEAVSSSNSLLRGPGSIDGFTDLNWESFWVTSPDQETFTAQIVHYATYENTVSPEGALELKLPEFHTPSQLPPIIIDEFSPQTLTLGSTLQLSVWSAQENLSYQWYRDDNPLPGETSRFLNIDSLTLDHQGNYHVVATNDYGTATSSKVFIEVDTSPQPPSATYDGPLPILFRKGDPLVLPVKTTGAQPISYQWFKGEYEIPGATKKDLNLGSASLAHSGSYYLELSNPVQPKFQIKLNIEVEVYEEIFPPRFVRKEDQPTHYITQSGKLFILQAPPITGSPQIAYSWYKDGKLAGQESFLYFDAATPDDSGTYYLEAKNAVGTDQSHRFTLSVTPSPNEAIDIGSETIVEDNSPIPSTPTIYYQEVETWDGEDALELYSNSRTTNVSFNPQPYARALKFRWKLPLGSNADFHLSTKNQNGSNLSLNLESGENWQEKIIYIPKDSGFRFDLIANGEPAKAWIDGFEIYEGPILVRDIGYTIPSLNQMVTLEAEFHASECSYQWYKDGTPISGATASNLSISSFSQSNSGTYKLVAYNIHGEASTSTVTVSLDSRDNFFSKNITPSYAGDTSPTIELPSNHEDDEHILFEVGDLSGSEGEYSWSLSTPVSGPATLAMDYNFSGSNAYIGLDGEKTWIPTGNRHTTVFPIPAGSHNLTLSGDPSPYISIGKIYSLKLENKPMAILEQSYELHFNAQFTPHARFAGAEPLTLTWFKNGIQLSRKTNLTSGDSFPFDRNSTLADQGIYHFEVTDSKGVKSVSNSVTYELPEFLPEVLDAKGKQIALYESGQNRVYYDLDTKAKGAASLRLEGPFTEINGSMIRFASTSLYASFKIRTEGFPADSQISYLLDDETLSIPANAEWREVTVGNGAGISLILPASTELSRVWIDEYKLVRRGIFFSHPLSVQTFIGARVILDARAYESNAPFLPLKWYRNGIEVPTIGADALRIESVSFEDLGEYVVKATSPNGDVISSRPATLSLLGTEFSEAIGLPGARITIQGHKPWKVDYENSIDGPSSIVSGDLQPGEKSTITIEIDEPINWGIYSYINSGERAFEREVVNTWRYNTASHYSLAKTKRLTFTVSESEENGVPLKRSLRLDRGRIARLGSTTFESWIAEKMPDLLLPQNNSESLENLDPDRDGIPNWLEFALALDPTKPDFLPAWDLSNHNAEISINYSANQSDDYTISYEGSFDMQHWFSLTPKFESSSSEDGYHVINAILPFGTKNLPYFIRWNVHHLSQETQEIQTITE